MLPQGGDESEFSRQSWGAGVGVACLFLGQRKENVQGAMAEFGVLVRKEVWLGHKESGGTSMGCDLA